MASDDLVSLVARLLADQFRALGAEMGLPIRAGDLPPVPNSPAWERFWRLQDEILTTELTPVVARLAGGSLDELMALAKTKVVADLVDPAILRGQVAVLAWADAYTFGMVKGIDETSRNVIEEALQKALTLPGYTREQLVAELAPIFGAYRAELIAVTEMTRAYAEGQRLGAAELKAVGIKAIPIWHLNESGAPRDPHECDFRDELPESEWSNGDFPPLHPLCVCTITYDIKGP